MFSRFLPREEKFFDLFEQLAQRIVEGAEEVRGLLLNLNESEARSRLIKDIEHRGDEITHHTIALLRKTFITPLDRDDMHHLVTQMDNILDIIDAAAQRVFIYDLRTVPEDALNLAQVCTEITRHLAAAIQGLANLKEPETLLRSCVEVNRLENEADQVLRNGLSKLFREEKDPIQLIKVKEILEMLEGATDLCEDVANIVDRIVLEHV